MPAASELVAHGRTEEEVGQAIGADKMIYLDIEGMVDAVREGNPNIKRFDLSVFTGEYITGDIDADYLDKLQQLRNDSAKEDKEVDDIGDAAMVMDLHNQ